MNRTTPIRRSAMLMAWAVCSFAPAAVAAQIPESQAEPAPPETATPLPPEAAAPTEQKLDQFADAFLVIEEIHTQAAAQLENVENPQAAQEIKAKAEGEIINAVEKSGLRLEEFNQIAELMTVDLALRQKVADKVEKRRRI